MKMPMVINNLKVIFRILFDHFPPFYFKYINKFLNGLNIFFDSLKLRLFFGITFPEVSQFSIFI